MSDIPQFSLSRESDVITRERRAIAESLMHEFGYSVELGTVYSAQLERKRVTFVYACEVSESVHQTLTQLCVFNGVREFYGQNFGRAERRLHGEIGTCSRKLDICTRNGVWFNLLTCGTQAAPRYFISCGL